MRTSILERDQQIIEAYQSGVVMKDIAPLLGMQPKGVWKACRRLGLGIRKKHKHSDELIDGIVAAYQQGKSFGIIMGEFNLSRGQVAGILNRAGVLKDRVPKQPKIAKIRAKTTNKDRIIRPPKFKQVNFTARVAAVESLRIPFLDRKPNQCAWIDETTDPAAVTCCGHEVYGTGSWCLAHAQIVFVPYQARIREPRPR